MFIYWFYNINKILILFQNSPNMYDNQGKRLKDVLVKLVNDDSLFYYLHYDNSYQLTNCYISLIRSNGAKSGQQNTGSTNEDSVN